MSIRAMTAMRSVRRTAVAPLSMPAMRAMSRMRAATTVQRRAGLMATIHLQAMSAMGMARRMSSSHSGCSNRSVTGRSLPPQGRWAAGRERRGGPGGSFDVLRGSGGGVLGGDDLLREPAEVPANDGVVAPGNDAVLDGALGAPGGLHETILNLAPRDGLAALAVAEPLGDDALARGLGGGAHGAGASIDDLGAGALHRERGVRGGGVAGLGLVARAAATVAGGSAGAAGLAGQLLGPLLHALPGFGVGAFEHLAGLFAETLGVLATLLGLLPRLRDLAELPGEALDAAGAVLLLPGAAGAGLPLLPRLIALVPLTRTAGWLSGRLLGGGGLLGAAAGLGAGLVAAALAASGLLALVRRLSRAGLVALAGLPALLLVALLLLWILAALLGPSRLLSSRLLPPLLLTAGLLAVLLILLLALLTALPAALALLALLPLLLAGLIGSLTGGGLGTGL